MWSISKSTSPPAKYDYHCFVSYTTREDEVQIIKPIVDEYIGILQASGVTFCPIWYDGWYLRKDHYTDDELTFKLREGILCSAFTTAFISPSYLDSYWCRFEWETTQDIHAERSPPAPGFSILPTIWKPNNYYAFTKNRLRRTVIETFGYLHAWYPLDGWKKKIRLFKP